jgi:hypothetical protein
MAEINIRDQIAKSNADARDRATQIESGKTLFLQDYQNLERKLEKELTDPGLTFDQRQIRQNRLVDLKLNWQRNGIGDLDVVVGIRDNLFNTLVTLGKAGLGDTGVADAHRAKLAEAERILAEAGQKGLI